MKKIPFLYLLPIFLIVGLTCNDAEKFNNSAEFYDFDLGNYSVMIATADTHAVVGNTNKSLQYSAAKLTFDYMWEIDSTQAVLPDDYTEFFFAGLVHIYSSDHTDYINNIVAFTWAPLNNLIFSLDDNAPWKENWKNGIIKTDITEIDSLISLYGLKIDSYHPNDFATLVSNKPYNTIALSHKFEGLPYLNYVEPNFWVGDGPYITAEVNPNYITYTLSIGFGDCPAGCISRHYWEYNVYTTGRVQFIKEYGNELSDEP